MEKGDADVYRLISRRVIPGHWTDVDLMIVINIDLQLTLVSGRCGICRAGQNAEKKSISFFMF